MNINMIVTTVHDIILLIYAPWLCIYIWLYYAIVGVHILSVFFVTAVFKTKITSTSQDLRASGQFHDLVDGSTGPTENRRGGGFSGGNEQRDDQNWHVELTYLYYLW